MEKFPLKDVFEFSRRPEHIVRGTHLGRVVSRCYLDNIGTSRTSDHHVVPKLNKCFMDLLFCCTDTTCTFDHFRKGDDPNDFLAIVEDTTCSICADKVLGRGLYYGLLPGCEHVFCEPCIQRWQEEAIKRRD